MKSEGKCKFCKKTISGRAMARHLASCAERLNAQESECQQERSFLLKASAGPFWVYFEVNASSTLEDVDSFLRKLWLECCGHLSAFTINGVQYYSQTHELGDKNMEVLLEKVIKPGTNFIHEYDFGTTTQLDIKCLSERTGGIKGISILTRNNLPEFKCGKCGKPAKEICTECIWDGEEGLLCESCAKTHKCEEEMLLPVVNSPRMGMCGYTGDAY